MIKKDFVIKIVWIVNDLYTNNFITVYNECKKDKRFEMKVIASPHIGLNKYNNISSNEVYNFLRKNNIECINSYKNNKYFDIASLSPDYIFTTTPYDIYLPEVYRSHNLKKIAKLCNVHYGAAIQKDVGMYSDNFNNPYYKNTWCVFTASEVEYRNKLSCLCKAVGYLKLDEYINYHRNPNKKYKWTLTNKNIKNNKPFKIVWKPRWTIDNKDSNLIKYLNNFSNLLKKENSINFVLLIHPLLISNLKEKGLFEMYQKNIDKLTLLKNFKIENSSDFLDCVLSSDLLIADHSSTIAEFAITGKPIIYTKTEAELNQLGNKIMSTSYQVNNFNEIETAIKNIINGIDPLKIKREANKNTYFTIPPKGFTIAQFLLETLYNDFYDLKSKKEYEIKLYNFNNDEIVILQSKINELSQNLENYKSQFTTVTEKNKTLEIKITELLHNLDNYKSENKTLNNKTKKLNTKIIEIEKKYLNVINSNSWKLTKPLRSIYKAVKLK